MGAWGVLAFDNDTANDWACDLEGTADLTLIEAAFASLEAVGAGYLDADVGSAALAACEVIARLGGRPGYTNAYTEKVDRWVTNHPLQVPASLHRRGEAAVDRVAGANSELGELWQESDADGWRSAVADLRSRLG